MRLAQTLDDLADALRGRRPVFVPTMGALHEGHLKLIRRAAEIARPDQPVLVSIFVNPTQFGPDEDYARYPRMLDQDVVAAASAKAEIVFAPAVQTIYPNAAKTGMKMGTGPILLPAVATQPGLEDAHRPGHFDGVCQVVARLFDLIQPGIAVFGQKDYQQLLVVKAMVQQEGDRWPGLRIKPHPTVRESDGLALSSRNAYLQPAQREQALGLYRALMAAQSPPVPHTAEQVMHKTLEDHQLRIDYAVVRNAATLTPIDSYDRPARGLIAARLGRVRLIDNMPMGGSPAD